MKNLPDLSVRHLRAIVTLARFQSFVAAAAYLGISQPGLTRLVQQAEKLLGVQLFVRGTRNIFQTESGEVFVQASERILRELALQMQNARSRDGELRGQLNLSSLMSISHRVVPLALMKFRQEYPNVHVQVREGLASAVREDVKRGQVDFGIANVDDVPDDVAVETMADETCFLVLPQRHALRASRTVNLKQLVNEPLISMPPESGLRRRIDLVASSQGLSLNHSIIINQFSSLFDFVANGLGVAIVPAVAMPAADQYKILAKNLRPTIKRRIGILHPRDRPQSAISKAFLEIFRPLFLSAVRGG